MGTVAAAAEPQGRGPQEPPQVSMGGYQNQLAHRIGVTLPMPVLGAVEQDHQNLMAAHQNGEAQPVPVLGRKQDTPAAFPCTAATAAAQAARFNQALMFMRVVQVEIHRLLGVIPLMGTTAEVQGITAQPDTHKQMAVVLAETAGMQGYRFLAVMVERAVCMEVGVVVAARHRAAQPAAQAAKVPPAQ